MSRRLRIATPAKVNLGLALVGTRDDGYHLLESVFAPVAVYDEVELEVALEGQPGAEEASGARIELVCGPPLDASLPEAVGAVPSGPDNLVWRAAARFGQETGFRGRIRIGLRKGIPAGAGLGGGSSDAAAVLRGLVELTRGQVERPVEPAALARWALGLGADVPFFLSAEPAFVCGIGERIEPLGGLPELPIVLVNPGKSLATAAVFRTADQLAGALTKTRAGSTMRALSGLTQDLRSAAPALRDLLINDLEPAARRLCPSVARIADRLAGVGAIAVSMTGSGATVLGVFESDSAAQAAADRIRAEAEAAARSAQTDGPHAAQNDTRGDGSDEGREAEQAEQAEHWWVRATRTLAHGAGPVGGIEEFPGASPNG